jgi:STE24 endopeptidase
VLPADCPERDAAAARLGAERRRIFLVGTVVSFLAPILPYLTGTWEAAWFGLAATQLPFVVRTGLFLLGFGFAVSVIMLPIAYYSSYVLPHQFDLGRQTRAAWAVDWLKGALLGGMLTTVVGGAFVWVTAAWPDHWWWIFAGVMTLLGVALVFATPYVLVPLFFKMQPLDDEATTLRIKHLVQRAGAPVRDVCSLDFSRRTAEANAAVIGIGRSRRVVLADTLLAEFSPGEVDAVVAHELGHHVNKDVQRLLLGNGLLMWLGLALAAGAAPAALPILSVPYLGYVPAFPVLLAIAELYFLLASPLLNWWSRRLEAAADGFALRLTRDPDAFAMAMRRIGCQNLIELRPPRWAEVLLATHPALHRRIELAAQFSSS